MLCDYIFIFVSGFFYVHRWRKGEGEKESCTDVCSTSHEQTRLVPFILHCFASHIIIDIYVKMLQNYFISPGQLQVETTRDSFHSFHIEVIFSPNNFIPVCHRFFPVRGIKQIWFLRYQKVHLQINILKSVHKMLHK